MSSGHSVRVFYTLSLLMLAACGESTIWSGLPDGQGAETLIIAHGVPSARTIVATPISEVSARTVRLETSEERIEAWTFVESLEQLELPSGPLREDPNAPGLPVPLARFTFDVSAEAWVEDTAPRLLVDVHVAHTTKCSSFDVESVELGIGRTFMLSPLPDGRVLHGFSNDETGETTFRFINADGVVELLAISPAQYGTTGVVIGSRVWIATFGGEVFEYPLANLTTYTSSVPTTGREWQAISGGVGPAGVEVFVLANTGELARVRPDGFETLEPPQAIGKSAASMLWIGPGELFAAAPVHRDVLHLVDGVVVHEELPLIGGSPLRVERSARRSLLAGGSSAEVYERVGTRWSFLATYPLMVGVTAIFETPAGLLLGADSEVREWRELEGTFCPSPPVPRGVIYMHIAQVGALYVAGGRPIVRGRTSQLALLRPRG